jgi:hypothetical protein
MVSGRTKMRLWYWHSPEFDLVRQFPSDERIPWLNRLLQGSVKEHEEDVWPSAHELLDQMDKILAILRRGGQTEQPTAKRHTNATKGIYCIRFRVSAYGGHRGVGRCRLCSRMGDGCSRPCKMDKTSELEKINLPRLARTAGWVLLVLVLYIKGVCSG